MSDTAERAALAAATLNAYFMDEMPDCIAKVRNDILMISRRVEPEREVDLRVDALGRTAILTDTQFRITLAPERAESRVVALEKSVPKTNIDALDANTQRGKVHIQIKAGFSPERHLVLSPAELALLYTMLDTFIQELPRVDDKTGGVS